MDVNILNKWSQAICSESYYPSHFICEKPELAKNFLDTLLRRLPQTGGVLHKIWEYVQHSSLSEKDVTDSLFKLRDVISQNGKMQTDLSNLGKNVEESIILWAGLVEENRQKANRPLNQVQSYSSGSNAFSLNLDKDFRIINFPREFARKFEMPENQIMGSPLASLFSPSSQSRIRNVIELFTSENQVSAELSVEAISGSGQRFQAAVIINRNDSNGTSRNYTATLHDISYSQENHSILRLMFMALQNVGEGIIITEPNLNAKVLFVNKALEKISGFKRQELTGKSFSQLLDKNYDQTFVDNILKHSLEEGWKGEIVNLHKSGVSYSVSLHTQPVKDESGEIVAIVGIQRDITRLKFLENLSNILNSSMDINETYRSFSKELKRIFPFKMMNILLMVDAQKHYYRVFYSSDSPSCSPLQNIIFHWQNIIKKSSSGKMAKNYFILNSDQFQNETYFQQLESCGIRQSIFFPIVFSNEIIGFLNLCPDNSHQFSRDDFIFIEQITNHLTVALKNCIHFDQLEKQNKKLNFIHKLFSCVRSNNSLQVILNEALVNLTISFGYSNLAIYQVISNTQIKLLVHHSTNDLAENIFPAILNFDSGIPPSPLLWVDIYPDNPLIKELLEQMPHIQPKTVLWINNKSTFQGEVVILGMCDNYLPDLSYNYHIKIMQAILIELALALNHALLFQKTYKAEKEWETTFHEVQIGLVVVDENFHIVRTNKCFRQIFQMDALKPTKPLTCQMFFDAEKEIAKCRETKANFTSKDFPAIKWQADFQEKYLTRNFFPLFSKTNRFIGGIYTVQDITKEHHQEEHIRYLSRFPEVNPNIVISLSKKGEIIYANPTAKRVIKTLDLTAQKPEQLIPRSLLLELENGEYTTNVSHEYIQNLGERVFRFVSFEPDSESNIYLYGMDITEQLNLQDKLIKTERMRAMGEMAAGVAHEFSNHLTTILNKAQVILYNTSNKKLIKEAEIIKKAANDGAHIVSGLKELTPKNHEQEFDNVYLSEIMKDSLLYASQKQKSAAQGKGQKCLILENYNEELVVWGIPAELKEVFTNLINNAFDAMPEGGNLDLTTYKKDNGAAIAIVKDTGMGISPKIQHKIFDLFFTTKGNKGTGLGLGLVYKIVNAHKGTIRFNSQVGQGTEFVIELPLSAQKPFVESQEGEHSSDQLGDTSLLVVDDELELLETIAELLKFKFKKVDMANSGKAALKKIKTTTYDVVLTDLAMPEMSGWEVAKAVKKNLPESKVILITGFGLQSEDEVPKNKFVDKILSKPYDLHHLLAVIEQLHSES